jgi:hypothetical protein
MGLWSDHFHWKVLLGWSVLGWVVALVIGIAGLFLFFDQYDGANICFMIVAMFLFSKIAYAAILSPDPLWQRLLFTFVLFGIVGMGIAETIRGVNKWSAKRATVSTAESEKSIRTTEGHAELNPPEIPKLKVAFKESPLFTTAVQKQVIEDISAFAAYLAGLGLQLASEVPPFGVTLNAHGSSSGTTNDRTYYGKINIGEKDVGKRNIATEAYLGYVIEQVLYPPGRPFDINSSRPKWVISFAALHYLNTSFWDERPVHPMEFIIDRWTNLFWNIRERWDKRFSDSLAVYTLKAVADEMSPLRSFDDNGPQFDRTINTYLYEKLAIADSVLDNACSRLSEITDMAKQSGIELNALSPDAQRLVDGGCGR